MRNVSIFAVLTACGTAFAGLSSPGFEQGPVSASISFSPTDANGLGWFASNTDGERIQGTTTRPAAEGDYYASVLQNAGAYDGAPLGVGDFGFTGFDRIYTFFSVAPNTQYTISFMHAGDDRFGYTADTSVVEVVDADTNLTITQEMFATPGLFDWQMASFTFTTGATTNNAAIAFTVMGSGNTSGMFDAISIVPAPGAAVLMGLGGLFATRRRR